MIIFGEKNVYYFQMPEALKKLNFIHSLISISPAWLLWVIKFSSAFILRSPFPQPFDFCHESVTDDGVHHLTGPVNRGPSTISLASLIMVRCHNVKNHPTIKLIATANWKATDTLHFFNCVMDDRPLWLHLKSVLIAWKGGGFQNFGFPELSYTQPKFSFTNLHHLFTLS